MLFVQQQRQNDSHPTMKKTNRSVTSPYTPKNGKNALWKKIGHEMKNHNMSSSSDDMNKTSLEYEVQLLEKEEKLKKKQTQKHKFNTLDKEISIGKTIKTDKPKITRQEEKKPIVRRVSSSIYIENGILPQQLLNRNNEPKTKTNMRKLINQIRILKIELLKEKETSKKQLKKLHKVTEQCFQQMSKYFNNFLQKQNQFFKRAIKQQETQIIQLKSTLKQLTERTNEEKVSSSLEKITKETMFKPPNTPNNLDLIKKQLSQINTINGSDKTNYKAKYYSKKTSIDNNQSTSPLKSNKNFARNKAVSFKNEHQALKDKIDILMERKPNDKTNESVEMEEITALKLKITRLKKSIREQMN